MIKGEILTSKGCYSYTKEYPDVPNTMDIGEAMLAFRELADSMNKIGIVWGPAFGTLLGIVRDDSFLPWAKEVQLYVLKEEEERFKDFLWLLRGQRVELVRYERRGVYTLKSRSIYFMVYVFRKISTDLRHSGGHSFIFEKYIQERRRIQFQSITLSIPQAVEEYLSLQYGEDWTVSKDTTKQHKTGMLQRGLYVCKSKIKDSLPDKWYYSLILKYHSRDFEEFKKRAREMGYIIPATTELSYYNPKENRRILTVGVFDLIHKGHVELFRRAKGLGDYLIVAVQDSDFILKYKPNAQVLNSTDDRKYMVNSIRYVDETITYTNVNDIVKEVDFDVFVVGGDQNHSGFKEAVRWCEEHGKTCTILARTDGVSSSQLKGQIAQKQ